MLKRDEAIAPHGGQLVDRTISVEEREERLREAAELPRVSLDTRTISDLQMISTGVFSSLEGFMVRAEYESVVENMHLAAVGVLADLRGQLDYCMRETGDPLLDGPIPAPPSAELNTSDQLSPNGLTTVVS